MSQVNKIVLTAIQFTQCLALNETLGHDALTVMIMIEVAIDREGCGFGGDGHGSGVLVMTHAA